MNKKILFLILLAVVLVLPIETHAQQPNTFCNMVKSVKDVSYNIGITLVVVGWVIAGILWLTSAGNPEKTGIAKKAILAAVINMYYLTWQKLRISQQ